MLINSFLSGRFTISVYDALGDVESIWNSFPCESLQPKALRLIEDSNPRDLDFRYVIVGEAGNSNEVCGILYFQLLRFTKKNIQPGNSFLLSLLTTVALSIRPVHILVCGNIFAVNFPSLKFRGDIDLPEVIEVLDAIIRNEKADAYFLKDMSDRFSPALMEQAGWKSFLSDMTMTLRLDARWNNFDDYIYELTKKYRIRAMKIIGAGARLEKRVLGLAEISESQKRIGELFEAVSSKQLLRLGLIGPDYFIKYKKLFPETFTFTGYFLDDKMIAFSTLLDMEKSLEIHYIGIDYEYNKEFMLYFNILFDGVRTAIDMKKESLELGRTAREAKASLGAAPEYFNDYMRIRSPFIRSLANLFTRNFLSVIGEGWKSRHPFRD